MEIIIQPGWFYERDASVYRGNIAVKACPNACRLCLERLDGSLKFSACDRASGKADDTAFLLEARRINTARGAATVLKTDVYPCNDCFGIKRVRT